MRDIPPPSSPTPTTQTMKRDARPISSKCRARRRSTSPATRPSRHVDRSETGDFRAHHHP
jgi:hypothetical protein